MIALTPPQRLSLHTTARLPLFLSMILVLLALPVASGWRGGVLLTALALLALDLWMGRQAISGLRAAVVEPGTAFTWEPFPVALRLHNDSRLWTTRDLLLHHVGGGGRRDRLFAYQPHLRPGQSQDLRARHKLPQRGRHHRYGLSIRSAFPFGLLAWEAQFELAADFLALPRLGELHQPETLLPPARGAEFGHAEERRGQEEFYALRQWREGMSQRKVHWKTSARQQRLLVRDDLPEERPRVMVHFMTALPDFQREHRQAFEQAVSCTATLLSWLLRERMPVRLRIDLAEGVREWAPVGRRGLHTVLALLAEVQPRIDPSPTTKIQKQPEQAVWITAHPGLQRRLQSGVTLDLSRPESLRHFRPARSLPIRIRALGASVVA